MTQHIERSTGAITQDRQLKITPFPLKFPNNYGKSVVGGFA